MRTISFVRRLIPAICTLLLAGMANAAVLSEVRVHGALYDPNSEADGGIDVLTAEIGTEIAPKTATEVGDFATRTISAWSLASALQGRLAFHLAGSIVVQAAAPSARLTAFVDSTNNRVQDRIHIGPGMGPGGPINEGDIVPVLVQVRLDAELQAEGDPSSGIHLVFRVRAAQGSANLPVIAEYDSDGLYPPQDFEVHEEWDVLIDVEVGEFLGYDALMSGWVNGTSFDPGTSGINFITADTMIRVSNAPGYDVEISSEAGAPATTLAMSNQFDDVLPWYWAYDFIESLADSKITAGCGARAFCPDAPVTRAQMAVFLERGMRGSDYIPPPADGNVFLDVGADDFAAAWIEQLFADQITAGCGNNNYCPNEAVTRAQMAVFLLRAKYGAGYAPPAPTGVFNDVDLSYWAAAWIEQLAAEGITGGCEDDLYCPEAHVTRDQMAVFIIRTFEL